MIISKTFFFVLEWSCCATRESSEPSSIGKQKWTQRSTSKQKKMSIVVVEHKFKSQRVFVFLSCIVKTKRTERKKKWCKCFNILIQHFFSLVIDRNILEKKDSLHISIEEKKRKPRRKKISVKVIYWNEILFFHLMQFWRSMYISLSLSII